MTCHNNIRILRMRDTPQLREWYRYLTTVTVFNAWDTAAHALNGLDKDSDSCLLTDNPILVENTREEPAILCVQRQAEKKAVTQEDLIQSNINSFGDEIGAITNRITSMFEAQARFAPGSEEYQTLDYRIKCGQLFQQNAIDKAKGILAKPMPKAWYSPAALRIQETDSPGQANAKRAQQRLLADKKPYFMAYLYPQEGKRYRLYTANANAKCLMEFGLSMQELMQKARHTPEEDAFLQAYEQYMPLGTAPCLLNRLCWRMEESFDGLLKRRRTKNCFDPALLKSGVFCSENRRRAVAALHENYMREVQQFKARCARAYLRGFLYAGDFFRVFFAAQLLHHSAAVAPASEAVREAQPVFVRGLARLAQNFLRAVSAQACAHVFGEAFFLLRNFIGRLGAPRLGVAPVEDELRLRVVVYNYRARRAAEAAEVEEALPVRVLVVERDVCARARRAHLFAQPSRAAQNILSAHSLPIFSRRQSSSAGSGSFSVSGPPMRPATTDSKPAARREA